MLAVCNYVLNIRDRDDDFARRHSGQADALLAGVAISSDDPAFGVADGGAWVRLQLFHGITKLVCCILFGYTVFQKNLPQRTIVVIAPEQKSHFGGIFKFSL